MTGKLTLMGARKFIDMPTGTFFIPFWCNSCDEIIKDFNEKPMKLFMDNLDDFHIYGDNNGSMSFSVDGNEDHIFYYDMNVVGDAEPESTLYLVIDESLIPELGKYTKDINSYYLKTGEHVLEEGLFLTKNQVLSAKEKFVSIIKYRDNDSAIEYLDNECNRQDIINTFIEKEILI